MNMSSLLAILALAIAPGTLRAEATNFFGAHMQQPEIVVSPESNGVMELTCKVGFIGGCCFPLTSHDVTASLDVPRGFAVASGPNPPKYDAIEAPCSGIPKAWATFHWRLQRLQSDSDDKVTITVSSSDSWPVNAAVALTGQPRGGEPTRPGVLPAKQKLPGYPTNGSTVAYLFLDRDDASRRLVEQMETYRRAVPHRLHVLCFVEGVTPVSILKTYRERFHVAKIPAVVFDAQTLVDGTNAVAVAGTLDRCFGKPASRLSMELHGGVIAGQELSLGFIMCNHASRHEARGAIAAFAFESGVTLDGWRCDRVVRNVMVEGRTYAIPMGKCQPPTMLKWNIPTGVSPEQTGALTVILDEAGRLIDSICTEHPCSRTGACG